MRKQARPPGRGIKTGAVRKQGRRDASTQLLIESMINTT